MKALLLFFFTACALSANAADTLRVSAQRPMSARFITTDDLGNTYAVHTDGTLARYNTRGDSTGFYRSVLNGPIGSVDATNPLRLLLYYPTYNQVQILDRQLTLKSELDLRQLHIFSPTAVATASDGNLWVYDPFNAKILKLDETGNTVQESIDLRQQLPFVPVAASLLERDRRLYLCDTARGILLFDQFATYESTLPFTGVPRVQAYGQQIVFARGDTLHSYNMQTFAERKIPLPTRREGIVDVSLTQGALAVLYLKRLVLYAWP